MNRRKALVSLLQGLAGIVLSACSKGSANTNPNPPRPAYKTLSAGVITTLKSLQASFSVLVNGGQTKYQSALDAVTRILGVAQPIADTLQNTTFPAPNTQALIDQITNLVNVGTVVAQTVGLPSDIVIAINLGVGVFKSIEPLILGTSTSSTAGVTRSARAVNQADPAMALQALQVTDVKYRALAKR